LPELEQPCSRSLPGSQITPDCGSFVAIHPTGVTAFQLHSFGVERYFKEGIVRAKRGQREVYPSLPSLYPLFTLNRHRENQEAFVLIKE